MTTLNTETKLSEYEVIRLKNIQRNLEFLAAIGLGGSHSLISTNSSKPIIPQKKKSTVNFNSISLLPSRRSSRIAELDNNLNYCENNDHVINNKRVDATTSKRFKGENGVNIGNVHPQQYLLAAGGFTKEVIDKLSTRSIVANYRQFITPSSIGLPHDEFGKASVVTRSNNGQTPKFSKYSGILEWSNCIYLWVNLGGPSTPDSYENTFLDNGRSFVWFGGSKMTKESPITQRMLRIGLAANENDDDAEQDNKHSSSGSSSINNYNQENNEESEAILLFVRIVGEPYCCLGQVTVLNCNFDRHPLVVHWRLTQYDSLMTGLSSENFKRILKSSPMN